MGKNIIIRRISPDDSLEDLTVLLHNSYKFLKDLGFQYLATHQDVETTKKRVDKGDTFLAECDARIVGTVTLKRIDLTSGSPWLDRSDVASFGQFAVDPDFQNTGIGSALLEEVEKMARANRVRELALDTAEGANHLRSFYKKRGYRFVEYVDWPFTNFRSVILSKALKNQFANQRVDPTSAADPHSSSQ